MGHGLRLYLYVLEVLWWDVGVSFLSCVDQRDTVHHMDNADLLALSSR
jgi:hypothetical protein